MNMRKTYRFKGGKKGKPILINFESLRKGDYFYMEEPKGEMVIGQDGKFIFRAKTNPIKTGDLPGNYILTADFIA